MNATGTSKKSARDNLEMMTRTPVVLQRTCTRPQKATLRADPGPSPDLGPPKW